MGNETGALQLLQHVLSLPVDERTRLLQNDVILAAVGDLYRLLVNDPENPHEVLRDLGWWHEFVSFQVAAEDDRDAHQARAMEFLLPIYRIDPDQVPKRIRVILRSRAASNARVVTEHLPKIWNGTETVSLDEVIEAAEIVVYLTPIKHPSRATSLSNLSAALGTRYNRTGNPDDLEAAITRAQEAVDAAFADDPDRAMNLNNLSAALKTRYDRNRNPDDLNNAIIAAQEAVDTATTTDDPDRANYLHNLSATLRTRYDSSGNPDDLETAITRAQEAIDAASADDPDRANYLHNLSATLRTRYDSSGNPDDLETAITRAQEAVDTATTTDDPDRAKYLHNLSATLGTRYDSSGNPDDLEAAITRAQEAVDTTTTTDDPDRAAHLSALAWGLRARFERTGDQDDIDAAITRAQEAVDTATATDRAERLRILSATLGTRYDSSGNPDDLETAITRAQEAVDAASADDPDRAKYLHNLGIVLKTRYDRSGDLSDLNNAITTTQEAVDAATTADAPALTARLTNLGVALKTRYDRSGNRDDLEAAIARAQEAVDITPSNHAGRAKTLSNLSVVLLTQFGQTKNLEDLNRAIATAQETVDTATITAAPERADYLHNLSITLRARYGSSGNPEDLNDAITVGREAVEATSTNHPDSANYLSNLGSALATRFKCTDDLDDLAAAIGCYRAAAENMIALPHIACRAATAWGRLCTDDDASAAFDVALRLLPRVTTSSLSYEDALARAGSLSDLGRHAAAAYIASGDPERAVMAVEQAGATIYSRMLRSRSDLSELRTVRPDLAARISKTLTVLNAGARPLGISPGESSLAPAQVAAARRNADAELEKALAEVRQLGGPWTRFFLAPDIDDLIRAAAQGPLVSLVVSKRRCDALIITTDGVHLVPLPKLTEHDARSYAVLFFVATQMFSYPDVTSEIQAEAHQKVAEVCGWMWDAFVGPVMTHLGYTDPTPGDDYSSWPRVWWIPSGPLAILPIHAAGHHDGGPAVMDRVISSTLPTIGTLVAARAKPLPADDSRRVLLVGMPKTPPMGDQPVLDLPGVAAEVSEVQNRLHATRRLAFVEGLDGSPRPTRQTLLEQLPQHSWVHLACHAYSDPGNPTRSVLLLSDHQEDPFTVLDLTSTPSNAGQLLFLSACTTARTGLGNLDEPVHFAAAALLAGYRQVIGTLWPLQDKAGAEVADFIYSELTADGRPISWGADDAAIAVHRAVQDQRRIPGIPIYTWATFVHFGA